MSKEKNGLKLSRRKALAGIGGIGVASAGAGLGTSAFFSDAESFDNNTLTAGELDLRIDWQQLYYGPEENADHYSPYGEAGYPFVNAHPDHDTTGEQSLDTGDLEGFEDEGVVQYSDNDANIQEYLTCDTLENFEVPEDFYNGVSTQNSLIELDDLKPGDCGEVTFSLHLCDNPGYIWWIGEVGEYDEELAKAITVRAWYDLECTNEFDEEDGDRILVESTNLKAFLDDRLTPDGRFLNPNVYGAGVSGDSHDETDSSGGFSCEPLGKVEWGSDEEDINVEDGEIENIQEDPLVIDIRFVAPDGHEMVVRFDEIYVKDEDNNEVLAQNTEDYDLGEIVQYNWEIVDDAGSDGMCRKEIKSAQDVESYDLLPGCTRDQDVVRTVSENDQGVPQGISYIEFGYCSHDDDDPPGLCFPENETFCVSFEWCLPTNVGNEVQGLSADFDLGFYTEQCRHNADPDGPSGFV